MERVSIIQCENYEYEKVEHAVFECLDHLTEMKGVLSRSLTIINAFPAANVKEAALQVLLT